jgi:Zn-dependent M16 (insulinase) family peptidase
MMRYLVGYTDEARQQVRTEILGTTTRDFKQFGEALMALVDKGEVVVLGSAEAIRKANEERAGFLEQRKVL